MTTIKKRITILYLSFFGTGFFPKAPGTIGSLATLPLLFLLKFLQYPKSIITVALGLMIIFTCYLTQKYQKENDVHDPQWIVIDETLGMLTSWLFLGTHQQSWGHYFLVFGVFRFFDIIKIWPASYFDQMKHGAGTILDDIVSGIFTGFTILFILEFITPHFS